MSKEHLKKYQFKPGQSGNPGGKIKLPPDVRENKKYTAIAVTRLLNEFLNMSFEQIKERISAPGTPSLDLMIGKIVAEAVKTGDHARLNFIFDRMIGKVKETIEHKLPKPTLVKLTDGDAYLLGSKKDDEEDES